MNTRFNPTANGLLHVGHLYVAMLNYHAAKSRRRSFILRFDDDQQWWISRIGREAIAGYCREAITDLRWAGIEPDLVTYESTDREENERLLPKSLKLLVPGPEGPYPLPVWKGSDQPYPFAPYLTAVKAVQDYRERCGLLIRGDELVTEFALYHWICHLLALPVPEMQFVPRLKRGREELSDMSKRRGGFKIADFRAAGWSPEDVLALLAESCLIDPNGPWGFANVKESPELELSAVDDRVLAKS